LLVRIPPQGQGEIDEERRSFSAAQCRGSYQVCSTLHRFANLLMHSESAPRPESIMWTSQLRRHGSLQSSFQSTTSSPAEPERALCLAVASTLSTREYLPCRIQLTGRAGNRDLTLYHALRQLQSVKPGAGIRKSTSFFKIRGTFSGGTIQTLLDMSAIPRAERGGEWSLISRQSNSPSGEAAC